MRFEEFTEKLLRPYITQIENGRVTREPKEFNDPIWGTIRLSPLEVTILDLRPLQRLRRIRQLGVVHLVYMAATHTRLEHSVGVVHQVQQIADSLISPANGPARSGLKLNSQLVETLRLAGPATTLGMA